MLLLLLLVMKWSFKELMGFQDEMRGLLKEISHRKGVLNSLQEKLNNNNSSYSVGNNMNSGGANNSGVLNGAAAGNLVDELKSEDLYEPKKRHKPEYAFLCDLIIFFIFMRFNIYSL